MIHTTENFFNKLATEVRATYFPNENHGTTENKNYWKATHTMELFNNGCLTYCKLIEGLAKSCNDTTQNLHNIVSKHILSFGSYKYKPKK